VSHSGLVLLRQLTDKTSLTAGLPGALDTGRLLVHDRGRVPAGLACAVADGAQVISDFPGDGRPGWAVRPGGVGADRMALPGGDRGRWPAAIPSPARERTHRDPWNPGRPARQPGRCHAQAPAITKSSRHRRPQSLHHQIA
jgi:hypothetical protein